MKENIIEFIEEAIGVLIFILAITLFVGINYKSNQNINVLKNRLKSNGTVYETTSEVQQYSVLGKEIIGQIINGLECDIQVDNTLIKSNEKVENIDLSVIKINESYKVHEKINQEGKIIKIYYSKE